MSRANPGKQHFDVTPSDATVLKDVRSIYCKTPGNCVVTDVGGVDVTYPMTAGQVLPFEAVKVKAASTGTYAAWR